MRSWPEIALSPRQYLHLFMKKKFNKLHAEFKVFANYFFNYRNFARSSCLVNTADCSTDLHFFENTVMSLNVTIRGKNSAYCFKKLSKFYEQVKSRLHHIFKEN